MSDVEQILDANFQRVQWAREVEAGLAVEQGQRATKKPNPQRRHRYLKGILGATDHPLLGRDELECILALTMLPEAEGHGA